MTMVEDVTGLPPVAELPDPFVFLDGSRVATREDWDRRRTELRELVLEYQYGALPPAPEWVRGVELLSTRAPGSAGCSASSSG